MKRRHYLKNASLERLPAELDYGRRVPTRVFSVITYLPRPVALKARREIYTYPFPRPIQKRGRVVRLALRSSRVPLVKTRVRIRIPLRLPLLSGSYVSLSRNRLNIHSYNQVKGVINAQEFNRRRYSEYKRNRRKASHGQLNSRGSLGFGSVAYASKRGHSIDKIADAALAARAIASSKRR